MSGTELDVWQEGYVSYLRDVRKLKPRTLIDVRCTLKKVSGYLVQQRPGVPLWKLQVDDYLQWLRWAREQGQERERDRWKRLSYRAVAFWEQTASELHHVEAPPRNRGRTCSDPGFLCHSVYRRSLDPPAGSSGSGRAICTRPLTRRKTLSPGAQGVNHLQEI